MPFPFDPAPATLWTLTRDNTLASCDVRFVPNGTEISVMRNGKLLWSRIFQTGDVALNEAETERQQMLQAGWTNVES